MVQPSLNPPHIGNATPSLDRLLALTKHDMARVNEVIIHSVQQDVPLITQITHHIVKSGGKRLRPTLTVACAQLLNYSGDQHVSLAAAVELIHTATLLHDDVVDESTMRRGIETANTVWSNQASVLVGDYLLSRAFQLMVASGSLDVLKVLSDASATISQGEVKQLMAAGDLDTTQETYLDIIVCKTATLFSAACEIAPIIDNQPGLREHFHGFGTNLGISFQLVDDALDYSAEQATLGKAIGDDLREGKITLPVIEAYNKGSRTQRMFWERVITQGDYHDEDLPAAMHMIGEHGGINTTLVLAREYASKASDHLHAIKGNSDVTQALDDCLAFCVSRAA